MFVNIISECQYLLYYWLSQYSKLSSQTENWSHCSKLSVLNTFRVEMCRIKQFLLMTFSIWNKSLSLSKVVNPVWCFFVYKLHYRWVHVTWVIFGLRCLGWKNSSEAWKWFGHHCQTTGRCHSLSSFHYWWKTYTDIILLGFKLGLGESKTLGVGYL